MARDGLRVIQTVHFSVTVSKSISCKWEMFWSPSLQGKIHLLLRHHLQQYCHVAQPSSPQLQQLQLPLARCPPLGIHPLRPQLQKKLLKVWHQENGDGRLPIRSVMRMKKRRGNVEWENLLYLF